MSALGLALVIAGLLVIYWAIGGRLLPTASAPTNPGGNSGPA